MVSLFFLTINGTIKPKVAVPIFIALVILDLWRVDKRHYDPQEGQPEQNVFAKTDVVDYIKQDKNLFRVVDLSNNPANWWAYHFIESVHGYSSAKLRVYQDMLDIAGPGSGKEPAPGNSTIANPFLWNLLNVHYIVSDRPIYGPQIPADFTSTTGKLVYANRTSLPRAWFVDTVRTETNPRTILTALRDGTFNPRTTAFVEQAAPSGITPADSSATVRVVGRGNQKLTLATNNSAKSMLVASEVFYKEWHCYVDGVETDIIKTNFFLRGVVVPAGKHTVEFRFESPAFQTGRTVSIVSNIIASLIGIAGVGLWWLSNKRKGGCGSLTNPSLIEHAQASLETIGYIVFSEEQFQIMSSEDALSIEKHFAGKALLQLPPKEIEFFEWLKITDPAVWQDLWADTVSEPYTVSLAFLHTFIGPAPGIFVICDLITTDNYFFSPNLILEKESNDFIAAVQDRFQNNQSLSAAQALALEASIGPTDIWHFAYKYSISIDAAKKAVVTLVEDRILLHVPQADHLSDHFDLI